MNMNNKKGFTLIEVLVVVAIIGLLASIVIVSLGSARPRARDTRRIADLRETQNALELYYTKNNYYPPTSTWGALETAITGAGIGVTKISNDPLGGTRTYDYAAGPTPSGALGAQSYVLRATVEDQSNPVLNNDVDGTVNSLDCGATTLPEAYYCVQL